MLRNVAGPHIQQITDDSRKLFYSAAGSLKILNDAYSEDLVRAFHDRNPNSPIVCRKVDDSGTLNDMIPKTREAIEYFKKLIPIVGSDLLHIEIWPNEKFTEGDELKRLSAGTVECARIVADSGARPVGFNLPVANPANPADAAFMWDGAFALIQHNGLIGYHNYTLPTMQLNVNLDLRHTLMAPHLPMGTEWALNEGMFDHGIAGLPLAGWRYEPFHIDADYTARYTRAIAQKLSADRTVRLWTPFGAGPANDWLTFQYDNEPKICQVFQEQYNVVDEITIGEGFKRMIPYLGAPLEDEVYHFPGTELEASLCVFANGKAMWNRASNETVGTRNDGAIFTDKGNNGDGHTVWKVYPV